MGKKIYGWALAAGWFGGLLWLGLSLGGWYALVYWLASITFGAMVLLGSEADEPELILEPLTLEVAENYDICWLETRNGYYVEPCLVGNDCTTHPGKRPVYVIGQEAENTPWYDDADYGIYWRCWADKPTDEDIKAAPWEGEL